MRQTTPTRRTLLRTAALATTALAAPFVRVAQATTKPATGGSMVLAWHTNIATRWLDPQQHDGGATPDNFLNAVHDALIKNFREELYNHPALAEHARPTNSAGLSVYRAFFAGGVALGFALDLFLSSEFGDGRADDSRSGGICGGGFTEQDGGWRVR